MKLKFIFAIILASCLSAHARLGESFDQCVARYGEGRYVGGKTGTQNYLFEVNGWDLTVCFIEGVAEAVIYREFSEISDHEIQNLLQIEGERGQWTRVAGDIWHNDSKDSAYWTLAEDSSYVVFFTSAKYNQRTKEFTEQKEDQQQQGL